MATTITGHISQIVEEDLSFVTREVEPEVDGYFSKLHSTSMGVTKEGIGRDWNVIHTFSTGVAGAFQNKLAAGGNVLGTDTTGFNDQTGQGTIYDTPRTFPGIGDITNVGYVQKTITLVQAMGNMALPLHLFVSDELSAAIANAVALNMKGLGKNIAQSEALSFYSNDQTTKAIVTLDDVSAIVSDGDVANKSVTVDLAPADLTDATGRIARIYPNMLVDLYTSAGAQKNVSGGALGADVNLVVRLVDYINGTFTIGTVDGSTLIEHDVDFVDGDYLTLKGSGGVEGSGVGVGPSGLESWLVNSGTVFGISLANYPQFKSLIASVGGVLDEITLNKYVGGFFDAYGAMHMLDSFLTTTGVLVAYIENTTGLYRFDRNNERLTLREGWSSMDYAFAGQRFEVLTSRYIDHGTLYGCKMADQNLQRFVPPSLPGSSSRSEIPNDIQFVAPWMGHKSIFKGLHGSSGESTEFIEAPFVMFREYCPRQIPGIKLTGLSEVNPGTGTAT